MTAAARMDAAARSEKDVNDPVASRRRRPKFGLFVHFVPTSIVARISRTTRTWPMPPPHMLFRLVRYSNHIWRLIEHEDRFDDVISNNISPRDEAGTAARVLSLIFFH